MIIQCTFSRICMNNFLLLTFPQKKKVYFKTICDFISELSQRYFTVFSEKCSKAKDSVFCGMGSWTRMNCNRFYNIPLSCPIMCGICE